MSENLFKTKPESPIHQIVNDNANIIHGSSKLTLQQIKEGKLPQEHLKDSSSINSLLQEISERDGGG